MTKTTEEIGADLCGWYDQFINLRVNEVLEMTMGHQSTPAHACSAVACRYQWQPLERSLFAAACPTRTATDLTNRLHAELRFLLTRISIAEICRSTNIDHDEAGDCLFCGGVVEGDSDFAHMSIFARLIPYGGDSTDSQGHFPVCPDCAPYVRGYLLDKGFDPEEWVRPQPEIYTRARLQ